MSNRVFSSALVHLLTASGALCGLLALHEAALENWQYAFLWLGLAAFIDAIDGPIARFVKVDVYLPRFSGTRLDLIVDYLNYCAVPAFMVARSHDENYIGILAGGLIMLSSLYHFADRKSKSDDGFFIGFPAIWNVIVLYFFVFHVPSQAILPLVLLFAVATFVPVKWVHPFRTQSWKIPTRILTLTWAGAACYEVLANFSGTFLVQAVFLVTAICLFGIGIAASLQKSAT